MDTVNAWTGAILGVAAVVGVGAGTLRWLVATLTRQMRAVAQEVVSGAVEASERRLAARLDAVDRRFDAVDSRFDAVERRFDAVDSRFDAVERRFEAVDSRFDALESKIDHLAEVTDLRLTHLEADMTLVKQHLLGSSAA